MAGLLDSLTPHQRYRKSKGLVPEAFDRATPEEGSVVDRGTIVPLGTYDNGRTGFAFPKLFADPVESFNKLLQYGYQAGTGDREGVEDAFNVAGGAVVGGLLSPRPRNSLGSFSTRIEREIHEAQRAANPTVDPRKLAQASRDKHGEIQISSPAGNVNAYQEALGAPIRIDGAALDGGIPRGSGFGGPLYDMAATIAARYGVPLGSGSVVSPAAQRMYERFGRRYDVTADPKAARQRFGTMQSSDYDNPVYTVRIPPSGAAPPQLPSWARGLMPGDS